MSRKRHRHQDIAQKNIDSYHTFAKFIRPLMQDRGHFDQQHMVLLSILEQFECSPETSILDAACGTGDTLVLLLKQGFHNVAGIDGCDALLELARSLPEASSIPCVTCRWEHLGQFFTLENRKFNIVYILGHCLPHADKTVIQATMSSIYDGLQQDGVFVFDMRQWQRNASGDLYEPGRPAGATDLGHVCTDEGLVYHIVEICAYEGEWQCITYHVRPTDQRQVSRDNTTITFRYLMFEPTQAKEWMEASGFEEVELQQHPYWKYLVVLGRKR